LTVPVMRPAKAKATTKVKIEVSKVFLIQLYCTKIPAKCYR
jgi:hypothetical protein